MDDSLPRIHTPREGETLEQYFKRYTDVELKTIINDSTLSVQFGDALLKTSEYIQNKPTNELQRIWDEVKRLSNYGRLKYFVESLKFVRRKLLIALDDYATNIELYAKTLSVIRLICSVGDITGSVAGILMKDSQFDYSKVAFATAATLGFTGTLSTVADTYLLINASDDIMQQIRQDQDLFEPIKEWLQQTDDLKKAVLDVFPYDKTEKNLQNFTVSVNNDLRGVDLFVRFFKRLIEMDIRHLRNYNFVQNMMRLFSMPDIEAFCKLMIFQQNPVHLEIGKMMIQLTHSPLKHIFFQHIPSLSPSNQNFWSPPVWGRISFNFVSTLHAFKTLKRSEISALASAMRCLKHDLAAQLETLERITDYVESKRIEENANI